MSAAAVSKKIALVTGANKGTFSSLSQCLDLVRFVIDACFITGIGYGIVDALSKHADLHVLLGARSAERGLEAVAKLNRKNVSFLHLDVDDEKSIESAAAEVKKTYGGNNTAGVLFIQVQ